MDNPIKIKLDAVSSVEQVQAALQEFSKRAGGEVPDDLTGFLFAKGVPLAAILLLFFRPPVPGRSRVG